jgi:general secretion pathway protein D
MMVRVGKSGRYRTIGHSACAVFVLLSMSLLVSCNSATVGSNEGSQLDVMDKVRSLDLLPRQSQPVDDSTATSGRSKGGNRPAMYEGTDVTAVSDERPQPAANGKSFDLNFENAPVTTVAKVVLGDILGVGYIIDPRVQGTVSLVSIRPVAKSDIIFVLENALRLSGVVLIRDTAGYRLTPLVDAVGAGRVDTAESTPEPGFGVSVVPLQHVSAQTLLKLMDSFATKAGTVRADATRNLLLIQGSGAERRTAVDTALSFDVDWMRGQSVGVFPVSSGPPAPIIAELEKIVDSGENGLSQNVIKFQPITRLNAIMVVSKRPEMLRTAATWIKRLDQADTERTSVHVYQVKYGDARQIARVLTDMFIGGSSSSLLDSADNQVAPGSGSSTTSSGDRLSNGNASNGYGSSTTSGFGNQNGTGAMTGFGSQAVGANGRGGGSGGLGGGGGNALDSGRGSSSGNGPPVLQGDVRITPDVVNNSLLIYADQANYRIIEATLLQVDKQQIQVAIDATIAEVTLTNDLSYGVQTYLTSRNVGLKPNTGSILNTQATTAPATATDPTTGATTVPGSLTNAFINRAFPGFNFLVGNGTQPTAILDALHAVTSVKVLSNPSLVVINNQVATLQVGDSVPISTGSATVLTTSNTVVNTIDYRNTGIILRVSPRISVNGNVRLDVEQEISNVPTSSSNTPNLTPTVSERKVKSSILVANGQTVLLAGLISEQQNGTRNALPVFDQIPVLGDAFGHQDNNTTRTELIIFIRPQIIHNGSDAHIVAEELRAKLRGDIATTATNKAKTTSVP